MLRLAGEGRPVPLVMSDGGWLAIEIVDGGGGVMVPWRRGKEGFGRVWANSLRRGLKQDGSLEDFGARWLVLPARSQRGDSQRCNGSGFIL